MRTVTLALLLALSTSIAAQVTVTATGLPAGATGTATIGKPASNLVARSTYPMVRTPFRLHPSAWAQRSISPNL